MVKIVVVISVVLIFAGIGGLSILWSFLSPFVPIVAEFADDTYRGYLNWTGQCADVTMEITENKTGSEPYWFISTICYQDVQGMLHNKGKLATPSAAVDCIINNTDGRILKQGIIKFKTIEPNIREPFRMKLYYNCEQNLSGFDCLKSFENPCE
jgi:hypothetical protein